MILEDEKKKMILKRLRKTAMKKFFAILAISLSFGIVVIKPEIKYCIVRASQIKPSPSLLHLGSMRFNHKIVIYDKELCV